jgi:hypothetical protein
MKKKNSGENPDGVFYLDHERHIARSLEEAIDLIRPSQELGQIRFWSPELGKTQSIFEIHSICQMLGLRARIPRVPLEGIALIKKDGVQITVPTANISVGGLGARADEDFILSGDVVLVIRASGLDEIGPIKAAVIYNSRGKVGFRFFETTSHEKTKIEEFIRTVKP